MSAVEVEQPSRGGWENFWLIRLFSSYGLVVVTMVLLALLTWLGTLAQLQRDVFDVQKEYFSSWIVFARVPDVIVPGIDKPLTIPLPGALLLLGVLFVNLLVGGIVRLRRRWDRVGILITHVGIALLLVAGAVEYLSKDEGSLALYERESANWFASNHNWEIAIHERLDGPVGSGDEVADSVRVRVHTIGDRFLLGRTEAVPVAIADLPVPLTVERYYRNGDVDSARGVRSTPTPVVDGFYALPKPDEANSEANSPVAYLRFGDQRVLLFGLRPISAKAVIPKVVTVGDRTFSFELRQKRYALPFVVELDDFRVERHPRSMTAKSYESDVKLRESVADEADEPVRIWMNNPLRRSGYTLYQSGWGPQDEPNARFQYSVFSVVRNPSDQWPRIACYVIAIGMLVHYAYRLYRYIRSELRGAVS